LPLSLQDSNGISSQSQDSSVQEAGDRNSGQASYQIIGVPSRVFPGLGLTVRRK
jgi:hypothetical protein